MIIVAVACCIVLISLLGQARNEQRVQEARLTDAVNNLYAPAYGLYQCKAHGEITQEEFNRRFRELLLFHRAKADSLIIDDLDRWLENGGQGPDLNIRIEAKLNDLYIKTYVAVHPDDTRLLVSSLKWLIINGLGTILCVALLVNVLGGLWLFSALNSVTRVAIILMGTFAILGTTTYLDYAKRKKLEASMKAIRSKPGRKG